MAQPVSKATRLPQRPPPTGHLFIPSLNSLCLLCARCRPRPRGTARDPADTPLSSRRCRLQGMMGKSKQEGGQAGHTHLEVCLYAKGGAAHLHAVSFACRLIGMPPRENDSSEVRVVISLASNSPLAFGLLLKIGRCHQSLKRGGHTLNDSTYLLSPGAPGPGSTPPQQFSCFLVGMGRWGSLPMRYILSPFWLFFFWFEAGSH